MKLAVVLTSEVAKILNVTPETVRAMERRGVLVADRTETNVRLFNRVEVERLAEARNGRRQATPRSDEAA